MTTERTTPTAERIRRSKRQDLYAYLKSRLNTPVPSAELHIRFGSSLRARISELNRDPNCDLVISNRCYPTAAGEVSLYTARRREPIATLFPIPERGHDDRN